MPLLSSIKIKSQATFSTIIKSIVISILLLPIIILISTEGFQNGIALYILLSTAILTLALIFFMKLFYIIHSKGISCRMFPFSKTWINSKNIQRIELIDINPLGDYLGIGICAKAKQKAFILSSLFKMKVIKIYLSHGKSIILDANLLVKNYPNIDSEIQKLNNKITS